MLGGTSTDAEGTSGGNIWRWSDLKSGRKMQIHGFVLWRFGREKIAKQWATVTPPAEDVSAH